MKYGIRRTNKLDEAERQSIAIDFFNNMVGKPDAITKYESEGSILEGPSLASFIKNGGVVGPGVAAQRQEAYTDFWATLPTFPEGYVHLKAGQLPRPARNSQLASICKGGYHGKYSFSNLTNPNRFGSLMHLRKGSNARTPEEMKAVWEQAMPEGRFDELHTEMMNRVTKLGYSNITAKEVKDFLEFWLWHLPVEGAAREKEVQGAAMDLLGPDWIVLSAGQELDEADKIDLIITKACSLNYAALLSVKNYSFYNVVMGRARAKNVHTANEELMVALGRWNILKQNGVAKQTAYCWFEPDGTLVRWSGNKEEAPTEWKKNG